MCMHNITTYCHFLPAATALPQAYKPLFIIAKVQKVQKFNRYDLTDTIQRG